LEASVSFYRDVLGLVLLDQGDGWTHFDAGGGALLELFGDGKASQVAKKPDQQSTVVGLRVADLTLAAAELEQRGVHLGERGEYGNTQWVYFTDPEGNQLEIKEVPSTLATRDPISVD
jgi:catechol 2,3-dioxygenase-like lactoylglutathione lyase family enzyme